MKFDLKFIVILILAGVALFQYFTRKPDIKPVVIKTVYDTVYKVDTAIVYRPGWVIKVTDTIEVPIPRIVDTTAILKDYFAKIYYKDVIKLKDSLGTVIIKDTLTQNRILYRTLEAQINQRTITKTVTVQTPPTNQVYAGFNVGFDKTSILTVTGGLVLKTKADKMYQAGVGLTGVATTLTPYIYGGMYWKIKLKK